MLWFKYRQDWDVGGEMDQWLCADLEHAMALADWLKTNPFFALVFIRIAQAEKWLALRKKIDQALDSSAAPHKDKELEKLYAAERRLWQDLVVAKDA